jgi:hypothetical protein
MFMLVGVIEYSTNASCAAFTRLSSMPPSPPKGTSARLETGVGEFDTADLRLRYALDFGQNAGSKSGLSEL